MKACFVAILMSSVILLAVASGGAAYVIHFQRVTDDASIAALRTLTQHHGGELPKSGLLVIVDYSLPSQAKRGRIVDLADQSTVFEARVCHGKNSGGVFARDFSNREGSLQSSLGLFEIRERYEGQHGWSYRLDGLSGELNSAARERLIVLHRATYAEPESMWQNWREGFRLGRSFGCFVLSPANFKKLEEQLMSRSDAKAWIYAHR
ncbi:MAG: murein L,D-transpeptidase catalytic domain-containing protein [Verrucomicrobiota bacterium]